MPMIQENEAWRHVHQQLRSIARRRAVLDAEEARCLREAQHMKLWQRLGYVHMNEYLERELGHGPQAGVERLRVALALAELPKIEANLADGSLGYSAVRELTRVATAETEQAWLDKSLGKNLRQIESFVAGRKLGDWPDAPQDPKLMKRTVRFDLTPATYALFRQVQSAMADEHGSRLDDSALMEILCRRALEGDRRSEGPAYQIAVTVCESCRRGWQNGAGREIAIEPAVVERARCDADVIGALHATQPERVFATVTPRVRRQVLARDHYRCTVPGCRSARNLDVHHIQYQRDGGGNELSNLSVVCAGHHQQLHDGILTVSGQAPHSLAFAWRSNSSEPEQARPAAGAGTGSSRNPSVMQTNRPEQVDDIEREEMAKDADAGNHTAREGDRTVAHKDGVPGARRAAGAPLDHGTGSADVDNDARAALVSAGYKPREARAAVALARPHVGANASLEEVVREAFRCCVASTVTPSPIL
jgi:RuvA, C-terminal domain